MSLLFVPARDDLPESERTRGETTLESVSRLEAKSHALVPREGDASPVVDALAHGDGPVHGIRHPRIGLDGRGGFVCVQNGSLDGNEREIRLGRGKADADPDARAFWRREASSSFSTTRARRFVSREKDAPPRRA
jgi:hypothetical protein